MRVALVVMLLVLLAGCSSDVGRVPPKGEATVTTSGGDGSVRRVVAEWDDVRAAVDLAVTQSQCGFLEWGTDQESGDRCKWYKLLTIREETGRLEICRESDGAPLVGQTEPLVLKARIGIAGDATYEKMLLDYLQTRLLALRGDKTAPIPDPWGINQ